MDTDFVVAWLGAIMERFDLDAAWGFAWSNSCSRPRLDAFGGGACIVTRDGPEFLSTGTWLEGKFAEAGHRKKAREIVARHAFDEHALDLAVHDAASAIVSDCNNQGHEAQIAYLLPSGVLPRAPARGTFDASAQGWTTEEIAREGNTREARP